MRCECEHASHFPDDADQTCHGTGGGHAYASVDAVTTVKTPYGTFAVCDACRTHKVA